MSRLVLAAQTTSIATSLIASGGIAAMSLFDIPELASQPASRSLPSIRWLFSRGSHIFPTAAIISSAGFAYLAIQALPAGRAVSQLWRLSSNGNIVNSYLLAGALSYLIAPWTQFTMIPTNFRLIELNEDLGGARSAKSAQEGKFKTGERSADDSVNSKGDISQVTDLSGPQTKTAQESTPEEDREAKELLEKFGRLNAVRSVLIGVGGIVGLVAALS